MAYYQLLDVYGKSLPSNPIPVITGLVRRIGMHKVGGLERIVTPSGEMLMQLLRESHLYFQRESDGRTIISLISCKFFEERAVVDYLQNKMGWKVERVYSFRNG